MSLKSQPASVGRGPQSQLIEITSLYEVDRKLTPRVLCPSRAAIIGCSGSHQPNENLPLTSWHLQSREPYKGPRKLNGRVEAPSAF